MVVADPTKKVQSLRTAFGTAVRMSVGNSSLRSACVWLGGVVHHSTIRRWQIKTAASIVAHDRHGHITNETRVRFGEDSWSVSGFLYKSDATDTFGYQGISFQTTVCKSMCNFQGEIDYNVSWPDVQPIIASKKDATGCLLLLRKQWRSINFPIEGALSVSEDRRSYRWVLSCTDAGGDQKGARGALAAEYQDKPRELWSDVDCQQHVCSNGNKESLHQGDVIAK